MELQPIYFSMVDISHTHDTCWYYRGCVEITRIASARKVDTTRWETHVHVMDKDLFQECVEWEAQ